MVHITLNVTCYLLLFTSRFRCVYAGIVHSRVGSAVHSA